MLQSYSVALEQYKPQITLACQGGNAVAMKMARSGCRGPHIQMSGSTRIIHWSYKQ
jgi:hypothetical protein